MDDLHQRKLWVQREFRNFCQEYYRLPDEQEGHWRLLGYLLLNPWYSELDHRHIGDKVMVPYGIIQEMYECSDSAESLLLKFESDLGLKLNVNGYSIKERLCRTIQPEFPKLVLDKLAEEVAIPYREKQDKVYFSTGETWTTYKSNKYRHEYLGRILSARIEAEHPAYGLVEYLHSKRVQQWLQAQCAIYSDAMLSAANQIEDENRRLYALRIINAVQQYGYVQYSSVANTKRIYSLNSSVLALPREIRKVFYAGTWNLDLKFAQLAIVAKIWNLPSVSEFLADGGNIWSEFGTYLGLDVTTYKPQFKEFLYSLFYGSSKANLQEYARQNFGDESIFSHRLIQELLCARNQQIKLIDGSAGAIDAFGSWLPNERECKERLTRKDYRLHIEKNNRSVLSAAVQSHELKVMLSLFERIKNRKDLLLVGWLHDGLYLAVTNHKERSERFIDELIAAISDVSKNSGMALQLEKEFVNHVTF